MLAVGVLFCLSVGVSSSAVSQVSGSELPAATRTRIVSAAEAASKLRALTNVGTTRARFVEAFTAFAAELQLIPSDAKADPTATVLVGLLNEIKEHYALSQTIWDGKLAGNLTVDGKRLPEFYGVPQRRTSSDIAIAAIWQFASVRAQTIPDLVSGLQTTAAQTAAAKDAREFTDETPEVKLTVRVAANGEGVWGVAWKAVLKVDADTVNAIVVEFKDKDGFLIEKQESVIETSKELSGLLKLNQAATGRLHSVAVWVKKPKA